MGQTMTWVGLDVHARSVQAAAIDRETGALRRARLGGGIDATVRFLCSLRGPVRAVYEAGSTGFGWRALVLRRGSRWTSWRLGRRRAGQLIGSRPTSATQSCWCGC
jgi:hypothetical protein